MQIAQLRSMVSNYALMLHNLETANCVCTVSNSMTSHVAKE